MVEGTPFLKSRAWAVWLFCLACAFLYHAYLNYGVYYCSGDDFAYWFTAEEKGLFSPELFHHNGGFAAFTGRFYYQYTLYLNILDKMIDSNMLRSMILSFFHLGMPLSLGLLLHAYTQRKDFLFLFIPLALFIMPIYGGWHLYYHWAFYYKSSFLMFVIGELFYLRFFQLHLSPERQAGRPGKYWSFGWGCLFLFLSSLAYEVFLVGYAALSFLLACMLFPRLGLKFRLPLFAQVLAWKAPALVAYASWYVLFGVLKGWGRMAEVSALSLDPAKLLTTVGLFFSGALPVNPTTYIVARYVYTGRMFGIESFLALLIVVFTLVFFLSAFRLSRLCRSEARPAWSDDRRRRFLHRSLLTLGMFFLASLAFIMPLAVTSRYQEWLGRSSYYLPSFYVSMFLVAWIASVAAEFIRIEFPRDKITLQTGASLFFVLCLCLSAYGVNFTALGVHTLNRISNAPWILLDQAFNTSPPGLAMDFQGVIERGFVDNRTDSAAKPMFQAMTGFGKPLYKSLEELPSDQILESGPAVIVLKNPILFVEHFASGAPSGGFLMASPVRKFARMGLFWEPLGRQGWIYGNIPLAPVHYAHFSPFEPVLDRNYVEAVVQLDPNSEWASFRTNVDVRLSSISWKTTR